MIKRFFASRPHAPAILVFLLLTVGFSYPAFLHLGTRVIGNQGDSWQYPLNLFFFRERLAEGKDPYYTDYVFHPPGTSLLLHNYTELHDVVGLALHPLLNDLATSNLLLLASTFLTAIGVYKLAYEMCGNRAGAAFAAIGFAFCPNRMFRTFSQAHMALTEWLPFAMWSFLKLAETRDRRYLLLTVLFSVLTCYTNYYFAVYLAIAFLAMLLFGMIVSKEWRSMKFFRMLAVTAALALLFLTPITWRFWVDHQEKAVSSYEDVDFAAQKSAELIDYLKVGSMNPAIRNLLRGTVLQPKSINTSGWVVLGWAIAGIFLAFRKHHRNLLILLFSGLVFLLLSLGPYREITLGRSTWTIYLPDYFFMKLPVLNNVRFPARFSVMVTLSLALAAGYALSLALQRLKGTARMGLAVLVFAMALVELCPAPIPTMPFDPPAVFAAIAKEPHESMLNIPYFPGIGRYTDNMRYILAHHKKIMDGKIARTPKAAADYLSRIPLAHSLYSMTVGERLEPGQALADTQISPFFLSFFDIHYLTVFPPFSTQSKVRTYVAAVFPDATLLSQEKDILVYRLNPARSPVRMDTGDSNINFLLYENWQQHADGEVVGSSTPRLMLPCANSGETLQLQMTFQGDREGNIEFVLDRNVLTREPVGKTPTNTSLNISGESLHSTGRILTLRTDIPNLKLVSLQYKLN